MSHTARNYPEEVDLPPVDDSSRTLLLALDAVPYRVAREAHTRGAFAGWAPPTALVAPFPSLTHPGFAALFRPFGAAPSWGYEIRYSDTAANRVVGGNPVTYRDKVPPWSELFDARHHGVVAKVGNYVSASRAADAELDEVATTVLGSPSDVVLAYLGATDGFMHLYEDDSLIEFLVALDRRLHDLAALHLADRGRTLRIVLFSDHGCGRARVHYTGNLRPLLRDAGLTVVERLSGPDDVVAPTFGIVNYVALFLYDRARAATAAETLSGHEAVDLAAFSPSPQLVEVVGRAGRARVRWQDSAAGRCFAYDDLSGDVLRLGAVTRRLETSGLVNDDGYADEADWFRETAFADYPDPLRRLADALTGDLVRSRASVLVSLGPGWSWGWRSAFAGGLVRGGRLKGTHGGLDRESTLGFRLVNDPSVPAPWALPARTALAPFAEAVLRSRDDGGGSDGPAG